MKRPSQALAYILAAIVIALIFFKATKSHAQEVNVTNAVAMPSFSSGLQQIYDSFTVSTNYAVAFGGGRATTGNRNLAYADYIYNVSRNVGLVIGYDYLWTAKAAGVPSQANLVKGGISFQAQLAPLKNYGLTNFFVTPFANGLVASGNGSASEILTAGAKTTLVTFSGWNFNLCGFVEKRTSAGYWDGTYACAAVAFSKGF